VDASGTDVVAQHGPIQEWGSDGAVPVAGISVPATPGHLVSRVWLLALAAGAGVGVGRIGLGRRWRLRRT
jgi:hypothetical protein